MKKVTRLLRPKNKKAKDAQYNALSGGNGNGGSTRIDVSGTDSMPAIHNYSKSKAKLKTKAKAITTPPTKVKLPGARTRNKSASSRTGDASYAAPTVERTSISSTTDNYNFNYSSLNRQRNSYSNSSCGSITTRDTTTPTATASTASKQQLPKRRNYDRKRWWRRLLRCSLCACARRKRAAQPHSRYKDYWNKSAKKQKRHRCCSCRDWNWRKRVGRGKCWRWWSLPCFCKSSYPYDSEEDDDIDGKFAAYIYEMQQRDGAALPSASADTTPTIATTQLQSMPTKELTATKPDHSLTKPTERRVTELGSASVVDACNVAPQPPPTAFVYRRRSCNGGLLKLKPRAWTWDDSLRSNSDRFLETLEEDELNVPHVCGFVAPRPPLLAPTAELHKRGGILPPHMGW